MVLFYIAIYVAAFLKKTGVAESINFASSTAPGTQARVNRLSPSALLRCGHLSFSSALAVR